PPLGLDLRPGTHGSGKSELPQSNLGRGHRGRPRIPLQARLPVNGMLPTPRALTVPEILWPAITPLTSSVKGIGLVMAALKLMLSPLAVPSKMSVDLPSSPVTLPVSTLPESFRATVSLRSPMRVCMDTFHVPSADIFRSFAPRSVLRAVCDSPLD